MSQRLIDVRRLSEAVHGARQDHMVSPSEMAEFADLVLEYFKAVDEFDAAIGPDGSGLPKAKAAGARLSKADQQLRAVARGEQLP